MFFEIPDRLLPGRPFPMGASYDGQGVNFAVFSASAEKIELCIFDAAGRKEVGRLPLPDCTDEVWHGYLPEAGPGLLYGYRAYGPYDPQRGYRFNHHKLLLDPYARLMSGPLRWSDALFGYRLGSARGDLSFDRRDSAQAMPKSVVVEDLFNWGGDQRPYVPWSKTVIYEAHVRGISILRDDIRPDLRGTFAALANPRFIEHLLGLGVTTLELMPVNAFLQDRFLLEKGLRNYWGYSPFSFFAPEPAYLSGGGLNDMRLAVRRLHAAGIEVILDVVYNHTGSGNEYGPTISFRGLDNASYFRLVPGNERYYINETGCGNTLNVSHPRVLQMVMDSLRYWAESFRIDGFRFDLGATLGREGTGFDPGSGFFDAILQDPVLSRLKLISEPWDIGPGGYQLGNHPPGFAEWNDKFRDGVRRFWRGDPGQRADFAARISGSADLFNRRRRKPWASINYVASHDGFTLQDVVSYNEKHNEANGENNNDGHSENYSNNWGTEGPTGDPAILDLRGRVQRALLATVALAQGTPMLLAGDEFGRSQQGNNNAYCQDNTLSWVDWNLAQSEDGAALSKYVCRLMEVRRCFDALQSQRFQHGEEVAPGVRDLAWFDERGEELPPDAWQNPEARALMVQRASMGNEGRLDIVLMLVNGGHDAIEFRFPGERLTWQLLIDSSAAAQAVRAVEEPAMMVPGHSVVVLANRIPEAMR
ncbi:glycogen debranching protein GlgX [Noviherbaspirillum denitrificans]|uniref:Glycogen debranching enzyme n=1 Tax=Noviherbaspirillum denitrificans TaxID=1968433 RepID=A0A254TPT3_9BURK|nr:glycogen debranching protein GlgX [Noviherbaspirillum denitrificans]OWW21738.1 glycogen debranching enzyme [Noviherbaspirillum denitrificans]